MDNLKSTLLYVTNVIQRWPVVVALLLFLLVPSGTSGQERWTWTDRDGKARTRADLDKILEAHETWVGSEHSDGTRADLTGAQLIEADLAGALLSDVSLNDANLSDANLRGARFGSGAYWDGADLTGAKLIGALLSDADLHGADLTGADLSGADLDGADLGGAMLGGVNLGCRRPDPPGLFPYPPEKRVMCAHLVGADLREAHLEGADLSDAELEDANFFNADVRSVVFQPKSGPEIVGLAGARNLETMTFQSNPTALVQLRKQFQDGGFRTQERKVTSALNRRQAELDGPLQRWFKKVAFDWTCKYGMDPGRPLQIWLGILLVCSLLYTVFIHSPVETGIYRIFKVGEVGHEETMVVQIRPRPIASGPWRLFPLQFVLREGRVLFWALFFSLMSAFNIGFRDINFGRWLWLLPRTEYDLKAKGWARTVAGFQSLVSVCLIALWVLTYFGRPFE